MPKPADDDPLVDTTTRPTDRRPLVPVRNNPGIYRRGDRYVVVARVGGRDRKQVKRFARTLAEARDIQATLRAQSGGSQHRQGRTPFVEYAQAWALRYAGRTSKGLKPQTRKDYVSAVGRDDFLEHFHGLRLNEVESDHIADFADRLAKRGAYADGKKGLSPRTVRNVILPIRLCFADARERGHVTVNPAAGLRLAPAMGAGIRQAKVRPLIDDDDHDFELQRLLKAMKDASPRLELLVLFLLQTGLRIGEALALNWNNILLDRKRVSVTERVYKDGRGEPKSKYGIRKVPLSPQILDRLRAAREEARAAGHGDGSDPVFANPDGRELEYHEALRMLKKAAKPANLSWMAFHTLRHTCASWLIRRPERGGLGCGPKEVQIWLGHHSPAFTMEVYGWLFDEDLPEADAFDDLLAKGKVIELRTPPSGADAPKSAASAAGS